MKNPKTKNLEIRGCDKLIQLIANKRTDEKYLHGHPIREKVVLYLAKSKTDTFELGIRQADILRGETSNYKNMIFV